MAQAGTPSLQTISTLGVQILDGLRDMHRRGYVFVDVKPDNFMVLKDPKAPADRSNGDFFPGDRVFFVDFGLMEKLRAYNGGGQRENVTRATLAGNACYCSMDVHECAVPAAKDDVEALVSSYVYVAFLSRLYRFVYFLLV
jgi:serine/threonine protein kinase